MHYQISPHFSEGIYLSIVSDNKKTRRAKLIIVNTNMIHTIM